MEQEISCTNKQQQMGRSGGGQMVSMVTFLFRRAEFKSCCNLQFYYLKLLEINEKEARDRQLKNNECKKHHFTNQSSRHMQITTTYYLLTRTTQ